MHGRSRMAIGPSISAMAGRTTSGLNLPDMHWPHQGGGEVIHPTGVKQYLYGMHGKKDQQGRMHTEPTKTTRLVLFVLLSV